MLDALATSCKVLLYAALLTSSGVIFALATFRAHALEVHALRVMRGAAIVLVIACIAGSIILLARLGGQLDQATVGAIFSSSTGAALFLQITGAILLLTSGSEASAQGTRLASASLLTLSLAFNGHAATVGPFESLFVFAHASAAAWWIGSLLLLRFACGQFERRDTVAVVLRFSVLAPRFICGLVFAGLLLIYALVDFKDLSPLSAYARNLAIKLAVTAVVLTLAAYNKFRLTPRLSGGDERAVRSLGKMIDIEILVIGAVLIATAILTTYTSPHDNELG